MENRQEAQPEKICGVVGLFSALVLHSSVIVWLPNTIACQNVKEGRGVGGGGGNQKISGRANAQSPLHQALLVAPLKIAAVRFRPHVIYIVSLERDVTDVSASL